MDNYFTELYSVDVSGKTEKKNGLTYLSWPFAWAEIKKRHPDATYTVYENSDGWNYFTDGRTCWVKTGLTVNGIEHIEYLPVMDFRNQSIPKDKVTSFDVNKTIQRSLTKSAARHGLGLFVYAGEDLPENENAPKQPQKPAAAPPAPKREGVVPTTDMVKDLELIVASVRDVSSANTAIIRIDEMHLIPEAAKQFKNSVAKKAMSVGLKYEKKSGFFVKGDS